jgi:short subunit fatty acids transporter
MQNTIKRQILEYFFWAIFVLIFLLSIPLMYFTAPKKGDVVVIDCTWSEISPDFSNEIREACRKARAEKIK